MLHFRRFPIIIRICLKDHLLSLIPLFHNITAGTNRVLSIIRAIGMFRKDTCDRHGVWPDRIRPFHMEYYGSIICGLCLVQHGKIIYCTVITKRIIGKRHSASPSVNFTSDRMVTVQVMPSSEVSISVARSYPMVRSLFVTVNVLWISGS